MPRPAEGYRLIDGTQVPGNTDITRRFKDSTALINWARKDGFDQAKQGLPKPNHSSRKALDIGTVGHAMIEFHMRGRSLGYIEDYAKSLLKGDDWIAAQNAFKAYLRLVETFQFGASELELSIVSEKHRFGGTIDAVGMTGRRRVILDPKVRAKPVAYPEDLLQLAGYKILWEERFPDRPVDGGFFLLCLPKDGGDCVPFHYPQLDAAVEQFLLLRKAYDLDQKLSSLEYLASKPVAPPAPRDVIVLAEPPAKPAAPSAERKPRRKALVMGSFQGYAATVTLDGWESFKKASA